MNTRQPTAEVEEVWRKSSYSGGDGGECLEIAAASAAVRVRYSKELGCVELMFSPAAWRAFVGYATQPDRRTR